MLMMPDIEPAFLMSLARLVCRNAPSFSRMAMP